MAGFQNQNQNSIAIGNSAGQTNQGSNSVAIGTSSGNISQGVGTVSIGYQSGSNNQKLNAIAIGCNAGVNTQGTNSIAIGFNAGFANQGTNSIAIGFNAGSTNQVSNSIVLNASPIGNTLNPTTASLYVDPIRELSGNNILYYNTTSKEITYSIPQNPFLIPSYYPLGVFYSTETQSVSAPLVTRIVNYNNTDISNGVYLDTSSNIKIIQPGTYRIFSTLQVDSDSNSTSVYYWLKLDGNNVPNTASYVNIKNAREKVIGAMEWIIALNPTNYFQIAVQADKVGGGIFYIPPGGTNANSYPASPSIITSVQRIN